MSRTRAAFEAIAESVDVDVGAEVRRVDVGGLRSEDRVDTCGRKFLRISFEGARIFGEIFFRAELCRVYEDGCDDLRAFALCALDKRHVASVKRPHSRNEADDFIFGSRKAGGFFHPGYGSDYFHCGRVYRKIYSQRVAGRTIKQKPQQRARGRNA